MKQNKFLFEYTTNSELSAECVIDSLWELISSTRNFIDLGCGMGAWSKQLEKRGISDFFMYDHPLLNKDSLLVNNKNNFISIDLDKRLPDTKKVDLLICIEVLEHFNKSRAIELFNFIINSSDLILFSAAIPGQRGVGHINEQWHSFWHKRFIENNYEFYDGFKINLFDKNVKDYVLQNTFLYYKKNKRPDISNLQNITYPGYELISTSILHKPLTLKQLLRLIPKTVLESIKHRLK